MNDGSIAAGTLERINMIPVSAYLLMQADIAYGATADGPPSLISGSVVLLSILMEQKLAGEEMSETFAAVTFRLEALKRIQTEEHQDMCRWVDPAVRSYCGIEVKDYFRAAAVEPLVRDNGKPTFDPASFAQRLLEFASYKGAA